MNWVKISRVIHRYGFGYFSAASFIVSLLIIIIAITGILLAHQQDLRFIQTTSLPAAWLPSHYQERLKTVRRLQGQPLNISRARIPLRWVILDLHTGSFFGKWGPWFYDLLAVVFIILSVTGLIIYLPMRTKLRKKRSLA